MSFGLHPGQVSPELYLFHVHLAVKIRGLDKVAARLDHVMRQLAAADGVHSWQPTLLAYFRDFMLERLFRLDPEDEWAVGYDRFLLSIPGHDGQLLDFCRRLYRTLMDLYVLEPMPKGVPRLSPWAFDDLTRNVGAVAAAATPPRAGCWPPAAPEPCGWSEKQQEEDVLDGDSHGQDSYDDEYSAWEKSDEESFSDQSSSGEDFDSSTPQDSPRQSISETVSEDVNSWKETEDEYDDDDDEDGAFNAPSSATESLHPLSAKHGTSGVTAQAGFISGEAECPHVREEFVWYQLCPHNGTRRVLRPRLHACPRGWYPAHHGSAPCLSPGFASAHRHVPPPRHTSLDLNNGGWAAP